MACAPGVEKDVVRVCPPLTKAGPSTFQAYPVIGLASSVELETSEIDSPTWGFAGNQLNAAVGPWGPAAPATVNECGALTPRFPAWSDCSARTLKVPGMRPPRVTDHAPALMGTEMLWSGVWPAEITEPANSCTVTLARS